jgi:sugar O-acyltransferase (sialic acid O-acetyltransferase NeuD family)
MRRTFASYAYFAPLREQNDKQMLIAGSGGHAIEVWGILNQSTPICFFNDLNADYNKAIPAGIRILQSESEARAWFAIDPDFVLGTGKPSTRKILAEKLISWGGKLRSAISEHAVIGTSTAELSTGLNIMAGAVITEGVKLGEGTLLHVHSSVHHNVSIGSYCEISPGCRILGGVQIGDYVSIGAGAIILPGIHVGNHAVIGAGAVVVKPVPENSKVAGVPARPL